MSSSSKKRKNKWKSIAVEEILPNAIVRPTTSWAEEVESELNEYTIKKISSISLPTAPRATCDVFIDENKINPNGPFTAYLSNLPYDITEDDIAHHFKEYKVEDIQLPKDSRHDRMRGFGYVQFKDKSSLLQALHEGEVTLKGRLVRISLPNDEEQNKDKGSRGGVSFSRRDVSDRIDGVERNLGEWRAAAPIPHDPDKGFTGPNRREGGPGGPFREPKAFDEPRPFTRGGFRDKDRDFDNRSNDRGGNRMFGKGYDRDDRGSRMGFGGKGYNEDREMRRDLDRDMRRDSNREMRREPDREMRREPDREMRREPDREMRRDFDREPVAKEEPKSRPKLEIQPRTKPLEPNVPEALPSSIFGGAKPVDTLKREMEIEAKLSSKAASQPVTRSRTSTPPPRSLTPHSYHSRSSSTSSTSSFRYRNAESVERRQERRQSDDESKDISSNKSHDDNVASETSKEPEFKEPEPPKNVWEQRKAASAAAVAETPVSDAPTSVIEKSNVYENPVDVNVVENRSRNEDASKESGSVAGDDEERRASVDRKNSTDRYVPRQRSTVDKNSNSDDDFVRYEPDHFSNPDALQYQQQQSSNRGGGPRYSDNSKFNFNRNNNGYRNRDNRRSDTRRPDNGQYRRDDNYVSRNSENSAFGSKWNSASRNRNGGPGPRRYGDRDNGYSQRDRYDNGSSFSKQSSCSSSTTNLRDDDRFDKKADERLNVEEPREDTETGDERVNIIVNDDNANKKTVENGNENGVDTDDPTRKSDENIAVDERSENDNAFSSSKNRKRDKKKKNQVKDSDQLNEKDGDRPNDRQKNQKDEKKKNVDNQVNEKVNNKNNAKNKEKTTKKKSELRRDGEDIAQMPKAKEEKAPNFQDSNRFKFLADE